MQPVKIQEFLELLSSKVDIPNSDRRIIEMSEATTENNVDLRMFHQEYLNGAWDGDEEALVNELVILA